MLLCLCTGALVCLHGLAVRTAAVMGPGSRHMICFRLIIVRDYLLGEARELDVDLCNVTVGVI